MGADKLTNSVHFSGSALPGRVKFDAVALGHTGIAVRLTVASAYRIVVLGAQTIDLRLTGTVVLAATSEGNQRQKEWQANLSQAGPPDSGDYFHLAVLSLYDDKAAAKGWDRAGKIGQ